MCTRLRILSLFSYTLFSFVRLVEHYQSSGRYYFIPIPLVKIRHLSIRVFVWAAPSWDKLFDKFHPKKKNTSESKTQSLVFVLIDLCVVRRLLVYVVVDFDSVSKWMMMIILIGCAVKMSIQKLPLSKYDKVCLISVTQSDAKQIFDAWLQTLILELT